MLSSPMKLIAILTWFGLAALVVPLETYDECRDRCKEMFKRCYESKCLKLPKDERPNCWMECAAGEVRDCYESCNSKARL